MTSGSGGGVTETSCTATIEPVDYADCFADVQGDVEEALSCPAITTTWVDRLEACANDYPQVRCVTQSELDAWLLTSPGGGDPPRLQQPASCEGIEELPPGCA
jgi:hypothetical protein